MVIKDLGPNFCIWVIFGSIQNQIWFILKQQLNLRWSEARVCGHPAGGRLSSTGADSTDSRQISTDSAHSLGRQCTVHSRTVTVHYCTFHWEHCFGRSLRSVANLRVFYSLQCNNKSNWNIFITLNSVFFTNGSRRVCPLVFGSGSVKKQTWVIESKCSN